MFSEQNLGFFCKPSLALYYTTSYLSHRRRRSLKPLLAVVMLILSASRCRRISLISAAIAVAKRHQVKMANESKKQSKRILRRKKSSLSCCRLPFDDLFIDTDVDDRTTFNSETKKKELSSFFSNLSSPEESTTKKTKSRRRG